LEVLGLFAYTFLDNPLYNYNLRDSGVYEPKLPSAEIYVGGYAPSVKNITRRI
jgi:hypothetical protein